MDPLDRLIQLANLQGRLDQRCQLQGSWALEHPQAVPGEATFHIVMAGTCSANSSMALASTCIPAT